MVERKRSTTGMHQEKDCDPGRVAAELALMRQHHSNSEGHIRPRPLPAYPRVPPETSYCDDVPDLVLWHPFRVRRIGGIA